MDERMKGLALEASMHLAMVAPAIAIIMIVPEPWEIVALVAYVATVCAIAWGLK
jgi:hypothetical protein